MQAEKKQTITAQLQRPPTTQWQRMAFVAFPKGAPASATLAAQWRGNGGWYAGRAIFCIPGLSVLHGHIDVDGLRQSGHSLVCLDTTRSAKVWSSSNDVSDAYLHTSNDGRLTHATVRVHASDVHDAERRTWSFLSPILGWLAFHSDAPIEIQALEIQEEASASVLLVHRVAGGTDITIKLVPEPKAEEQINITNLSHDVTRLHAMYREGLNSYNVFYQFLCFWKVTEWCGGNRKVQERSRKRRGLEPLAAADGEVMPLNVSELDLVGDRDAFTRYLGWKYGDVLNGLDNVLRNAIAHLTPGRQTVDPDDYDDRRACEEAVPVVKFVARRMLATDQLRGILV